MQNSSIDDPRAQYWHHHVLSWHDSGLSKARYCRDNDITYHLFVYWSAKFSGDSHNAIAEQPGKKKLIPVMLDNTATAVEGLSVHLPNGISINGIDQRTVDLLGPVVAQL